MEMWDTGMCKKDQNTAMDKCPNCGAPKSKGVSLIKLHGDWICLNCSVNNFAVRILCYGCGKPKNTSGNIWDDVVYCYVCRLFIALFKQISSFVQQLIHWKYQN